jgi:fatty-acyl-CoA synthase
MIRFVDKERDKTMKATMMKQALSLNEFLARAKTLYPKQRIISRLPDKSLIEHSYADFAQRSYALARALLELGLQRGERVATLCWNHHAHLEAYFGIPACGGVMHTLNLRLAPDEIAWIAAHAQDRFLIVDDVLLPLYKQFAHLYRFEKVIVFRFSGQPGSLDTNMLDYESLIAAISMEARENFCPAAHDEDDPIAMCYTSGTTGRPKGVVYSHRSTVLHSLISSLPDSIGLSGRDHVMPVTPMFHANSWGIPYAAVMVGASMVFPGPHLGPADLLDLMQIEPPTVSLGVPTIWMSLIQLFDAHPGRWTMPAGMRSLVGGAAVPEALIRAFAAHGVAITQGWGMTETSPVCTISTIKSNLQALGDDERFALNAMAGVTVPLVALRLRTEEGENAPWDGKTVGEIQVRGPTITGSYHWVEQDPEKFTPDGWLRTGDVASINSEGYVRISDRTKDLIKSGGEWISSVDLENAIMAYPSIAEAAVIAMAHPKWTERPLACVVLKPGQSLDEAAIRAFLIGKGFARWQLPDAFEVMSAIPRTSTGKFWKVKLREQFNAYRFDGSA